MEFQYLHILLIFLIYTLPVNSHLWMTIDLKKIEFRPCIEAPGCSPIRATQMRV